MQGGGGVGARKTAWTIVVATFTIPWFAEDTSIPQGQWPEGFWLHHSQGAVFGGFEARNNPLAQLRSGDHHDPDHRRPQRAGQPTPLTSGTGIGLSLAPPDSPCTLPLSNTQYAQGFPDRYEPFFTHVLTNTREFLPPQPGELVLNPSVQSSIFRRIPATVCSTDSGRSVNTGETFASPKKQTVKSRTGPSPRQAHHYGDQIRSPLTGNWFSPGEKRKSPGAGPVTRGAKSFTTTTRSSWKIGHDGSRSM